MITEVDPFLRRILFRTRRLRASSSEEVWTQNATNMRADTAAAAGQQISCTDKHGVKGSRQNPKGFPFARARPRQLVDLTVGVVGAGLVTHDLSSWE
jgi:hypothetical protein